MAYSMVRHSNNRIELIDQRKKSRLEITLESSYQRDLFALVFKRMNIKFVEELSKTDL